MKRQRMRNLLAIFLLLVSTVAWGQNRVLMDSLSAKLKETPRAQQFDLLNRLGWEYRFSKPDSTIYFAKKAYELGSELELKLDLAKPLNYMGVAANYQGNRLQAFEYYQQAILIAEKQTDTVQLAYTNNNIGRLFFDQGLLPRSFNYYVTALTLFKKTTDSSGIAYVRQSLANLHRLQKDFSKAESEHLGALQIRLQLKNKRDIMSAFTQIGILYQEEDRFDQSTFYFLKADSIARLMGDNINLAELKILLAENYLYQSELTKAQTIGTQGYEVIYANQNARMLPRALLLMGKVYQAKKDYLRARNRFLEALSVARISKSSAFQIEAHLKLAEVAKLMGNRQEEISNMNQYLVLKDSVQDLELARKVERLQFEVQIQNKEKENEVLKLKQIQTETIVRQQRFDNTLSWVIAAFAILLAIFAFYIGYKRRVNNLKLSERNQQIIQHQKEIDKQNEILQKSNRQLSEINNEKDTLMSIVAHDLKAPLNRITGLVSLIEMDGELNIAQQDYVHKVKEVAQSSSGLIADLLDVNAIETEKNIPILKAFSLAELVSERVEFFKLIAAAKKIRIEFSDTHLPSVISDPHYVSRILDNLLSNAIKFSYPAKTIWVGLKINDGKAQLTVRDEGQGFLESDKATLFQKFKRLSARPTAGESSNGLGLAIVKILVDRLKGEVTLSSQPGKGSEFLVTIPI
jgi:signal transduction histidine kinase